MISALFFFSGLTIGFGLGILFTCKAVDKRLEGHIEEIDKILHRK